jgi:hypothetical protein
MRMAAEAVMWVLEDAGLREPFALHTEGIEAIRRTFSARHMSFHSGARF